MHGLKSLSCYSCNQLIFKLPMLEVEKMERLSFMCECCGHINQLKDYRSSSGKNMDKTIGISSIYDLDVVL